MIQQALMPRRTESWWLNVAHALILKKTFRMNGRKLAHSCKWVFKYLEPSNVRDRFLYTLYIAIDGNFKLKGKEHHLKDVELMPGWGAYVPEQEYQFHIVNYIDQREVSVNMVSKIHKANTGADQYMSPSTTRLSEQELGHYLVMLSPVLFW